MSQTIGANDTAKDLIPGNPEQLESLEATLRGYAGAFKDAKRRLRTVDEDEWQGATAMDFRSAVRHIPDTLDSAHEEFTKAAKAVSDYAEVLRSAQQKAKPIVEDAADARQQSKTHQQDVDDYNAAVERGDDPMPKRPPETDPGSTAMGDCVERLNGLRGQVDEAADLAKRRLDAAGEAAPAEPGWFDKLLSGGGNLFKGLYEGVDSVGSFTDTLMHPSRWGMSLATATDGMIYASQHPKEFAKAVSDWDTLKSEPARWFGRILPEAALGFATGGGATAARGARASQRLADRVSDLRKGDKGRQDTGDRPDDVGRPDGDKSKAGEPVDIATGEMSLTHTDLALPGALALVLRRTHLSNYGAGGWFGPSWAATLDQHLEVDEEGVVFAAEDGMLLAYAHPEKGVPVYPAHGPRWPLCWDGEPDPEYRITDPQTGRTLVFAPHPQVGHPLVAVEDRAARRIDIDHDPETGRPTAVRHSGGYHVAIETHPELPRITALRLDDTLIVTYDYDEAGNLAAVTNSSGQALRFTYDGEDRITSWTDRNGTSFGYVYDQTGRVLRTLGPDGMWSGSFRYQPEQRRTTYTDSLGHATAYDYDARCKLLRTTDPLGNTTSQVWTPDGRHLASRTNPLGETARYGHDDAGNLTRVVLPDGSHAGAVYNELNLPVLVTEIGGATWQYTYDEWGNRLTATDPAGAVTSYAYDPAGHLSAVTDALGHTRHFSNNQAGLPLAITDPDGHTSALTRDAFGRPTAFTDARGCTTHMGWSVEGKPLWRERPNGARESWIWDGEGNLLTHTDPVGGTKRYTYTHFDRVASRTTADGAELAFAYDTELRLTAVTNSAGLTWSYTYDAAGRLVAETDFNGRTLTYTQDAAGRLASRTNGAGETETLTRDALGRVTSRVSSDGRRTAFAYSPAGQLTAMSNPDATVDYAHDALGRVLSETVNGANTAYTYDAIGRRTSRTTPSGLVSTWTHGSGHQPLALTHSTGHRLDFGYDAAGREITRSFDDDAFFLQTWDSGGHLTSQSVRLRDHPAEPIQDRSYTYRSDGHVTELSDSTTGTRRYDLTPTGRVTALHGAEWSESYAYDTTGNLTSATTTVTEDSDGIRESTGTLLHRAGRTHYTYDAQGRLIRRSRRLLNGQKRTWTYIWNTEDRLTETATPDGTRWRYTYDALGRRIAKHRLSDAGQPEDTIHFTWDGTRLAEQTTAEGTSTTWDYAPGTHRPLTQTTTTQADYDARFHAIITDLVGTPTELLTPDGDIAWQQRTTLWGTPLASPTGTSGIDCPLRYPGQYADDETGLHYNNQRYYDPETARYLTPDPLGLQPADNHHGYVHNPLAWIDPLGLYECSDAELGHKDPASQSGDVGRVADTIAAHADEKGRSIPGVDDLDVPQHLEDVMSDTQGHRLRDTSSGIPRWGWWDDATDTMVIREGDNGTFMQPDDGHDYFLEQLRE
ncbi:hypothetical protein AN219_37835 [Streptomyces nanshensis]|nr:hypothetical protein AN219_37835 [Streptomyces nanshensis]